MVAQTFTSPCAFNAVAGGVGAFVVASAVAGKDVPENLAVIEGKSYQYYARNIAGTVWENGKGLYTKLSHSLSRIPVSNSDNSPTPVNFAEPPIVVVFPSPPPLLEVVPMFLPGTLMLFQQSAAPVGWTKQTTHNDKALRVVSGAVGSGGTNSFSSVMARPTVGAHALTIAEMPTHAHSIQGFGSQNLTTVTYRFALGSDLTDPFALGTDAAGGGETHDHSLLLDMQYVDLIVAMKD